MDKLKFALLSIVVLSLLGIAGYWAVVTIQSGNESVTSQRVKQLEKENGDLAKEVKDLESKLGTLKAGLQTQIQINTPSPVVSSPTAYKNQGLINELQKLIDGNIFLKLGSKGTQVGTVQKFLNIYNNTSSKVDNDYGASTVKVVTAFQKDQGLGADGQAASSTFTKMINWLKKQG